MPLPPEEDEAGQNLTEDAKAVLYYCFRWYDKDNKEFITPQDLNRTMQALKNFITEADIYQMIKMADLKRNGVVDFNEFLTFMGTRIKRIPDPDTVLHDAIHIFDIRGTGYITLNELSYLMAMMDEELNLTDIIDIRREIRINSNDELSLQELFHFMVEKKTY